MTRQKKTHDPFRWFDSSPEIIRLVVMTYVRYPLSLRNVEDLLFERGVDICHERVRLWWNRFDPMFAADIRRKRVDRMRGCCQPKRIEAGFAPCFAGFRAAANALERKHEGRCGAGTP